MPNFTPTRSTVAQNGLFAVLLMVGATLLLPLLNIVARYLSATLPPLEISFGRFLSQLLICVAVALILGRLRNLFGRRFKINALRGVLLGGAVLLFFSAVKYMPVATAVSIFFVEPMVLTVLAAIFLKERIGLHRIGAVVVGLAGAMVILRPSLAEIGLVSLLPLGTAVLYAVYVLINRIDDTPDDVLAIQFGVGFSGFTLMGLALLGGTAFEMDGFDFVVPNGFEILLMFVIGVLSFVAHGMVVVAFQRGEASLLAPLQYNEIVGATIFGYLVFSEFPDAMTWVGILLIVASGIYITYRERAASKANAKLEEL